MNIFLKLSLFICIILYIALLYFPFKINYKKFKYLKRICLNISSFTGFTSRNSFRLLRFLYLLILGILPFSYLTINNFKKLNSSYSNIKQLIHSFINCNLFKSTSILIKSNSFKSIIILILSIVAILEISFFVIIVIVEYLMRKDSRQEISNVKWISFDIKNPKYTGIIRPILYTIFEIFIFYYGILYILNKYFNFNIGMCIIALAIIYSISKLVLTYNKEQTLIYGIWSFSLNLVGSCLYIYTGSIILLFILYLFYSFIVVFKQ